jgi:hypothetical protein
VLGQSIEPGMHRLHFVMHVISLFMFIFQSSGPPCFISSGFPYFIPLLAGNIEVYMFLSVLSSNPANS